MERVWQYINPDEDYLIEVQRGALCHYLNPDEVDYIDTYWRPKERQVLRCYTRLLPNLGCSSLQRVESFTQSSNKSLTANLRSNNLPEGSLIKFNESYVISLRMKIDRASSGLILLTRLPFT